MKTEQKQHTSAPWHVGMKPGPMIYGSLGEQVADLRCDFLPKGEQQANMRLILAAPDLLHALHKIDANAAESVEWIRRVAREAITKATSA